MEIKVTVTVFATHFKDLTNTEKTKASELS